MLTEIAVVLQGWEVTVIERMRTELEDLQRKLEVQRTEIMQAGLDRDAVQVSIRHVCCGVVMSLLLSTAASLLHVFKHLNCLLLLIFNQSARCLSCLHPDTMCGSFVLV